MSAELIRLSPLFDAAWYLARNPDVAAAETDPAEHYLNFGWKEGREPGPDFGASRYLRAHSDVRESGMNPLLHYLQFGRYEGRLISSQHESWVDECDTLDEGDRSAIEQDIGQLAYRPLFSIVVPVFRTNLKHLREMLASVLAQAYPHWECCIADDFSDDPEITGILESALADSRFRLAFRTENGNICAATNTALEMATGEFVCFLDHDDLLHENALYEIAVELNAHPETDILFTDCDSVDDSGRRFDPYFKSDWNYDLMLGQNAVGHLGAYRRTVVNEVGRMRVGYEGSQDYDLALRAADASGPNRIRHVPSILYHWRRSASQASFSDTALDRCVTAARQAITDHLQRRGIDAQVEPCLEVPNFSRVIYPIPDPAPLISVCVFETGDSGNLLQCVFDVIFATNYEPKEVLVAPREISAAVKRLEQAGLIRVLPPAGGSLSAKALMAGEARGEVVILLDSDLRVRDPLWIGELVSHALREDVGAVAPVVEGLDGRIHEAAIVLGAEHSLPCEKGGYCGYFANLVLTREVSAVPASCLAIRRSVYRSAGGFIERATLREGEVDFCGRVRAKGFRNLLTAQVKLHRAGPYPEPLARLPLRAEDPFYNPNLSLDQIYGKAVRPSRRIRPWQATKQRLLIGRGQRERAARLLAGVDRSSARILEVGASYSPIAPRSEGWNTKIVDHATREELVEKYKRERDVWVDRIEEVDFIWSDGSIADSIPQEFRGSFDVLVASHVIEHVTDFIGFLKASAIVLSETGAMILAVPDKRFCFDYFRTVSMTGDVLEAHLGKRARHTRRIAYEQWFHTSLNGGEGAWGQAKVSDIRLANTFDDAVAKLRAWDADSSGAYVDLHAWRFTPCSFQLLLLELARLGYVDWMVDRITPAIGCEFHATLRRGALSYVSLIDAKAFDAMRLELLKNILQEIGYQAKLAE